MPHQSKRAIKSTAPYNQMRHLHHALSAGSSIQPLCDHLSCLIGPVLVHPARGLQHMAGELVAREGGAPAMKRTPRCRSSSGGAKR